MSSSWNGRLEQDSRERFKLAFSCSSISMRVVRAVFTTTCRSSLLFPSNSEFEGADIEAVGSPEVVTPDSVTNDCAKGEGDKDLERDRFACFFLGCSDRRMVAGHFIGDANLFPSDKEGNINVSPSGKCLLRILTSLGRSFSRRFSACNHCCFLSGFPGNRCMCTPGSCALVCLQI